MAVALSALTVHAALLRAPVPHVLVATGAGISTQHRTLQHSCRPNIASIHANAAWLPACSAAQAPLVALASGSTAALAQTLLSRGMSKSAEPAVATTAGYRAHHAIAFCFMLFASIVGGAVWCSSGGWAGVAASRFATLGPASDTVRFLAAVLLGELLLWDLPTAFWVKRLRRPDMLVHHAAMAIVAALVMRCPVFYGAFYLGFIEISTLPLTANEFFGAAHEANEKQAAAPLDAPSLAEPSLAVREGWMARLAWWRDATQVLAALSFVVVRGFLFTRVTIGRFVPECTSVLRLAGLSVSYRASLQLMIFFTLSFNVLQLYWLFLLLQYTSKQGLGGERPA